MKRSLSKKRVHILNNQSGSSFVVNQPVEDIEDGDTEEEHVPKPEEEVDLLIDDVLGEDAEAVVSLLVASSSNIGDVTGHLCREDRAQRVPERL